jgi:photosystem II stability/assembly factor-like uncharacterized protein
MVQCDVRTTDGGRTWARVPAPALPTQGELPTLRFADARNGFAFVGDLFYATHDGGTSWRRVRLGEVFSLATSGRRAAAVTARSVEASSVSGDVWRPLTVPFTPVSVALLGHHVWILGTRSGEKLARSDDGGTTFTVGSGPCYPGLGGQLEPASADVVWVVCPTGMLAGASRSTDGGKSFEPVTIPRCCINALQLVALSARVALVAPSAPGRPTFLRTADGGRTWSSARTPAPTESVFSLELSICASVSRSYSSRASTRRCGGRATAGKAGRR